MKGIVYLIGAGSGDKGLLTIKGLDYLKKADVIIYDKLASNSLLNVASTECELIFAGKEAGIHHLKQSETNQLLIEKAKAGKIVVRLKGGDPFIFGRGGEEAEALANEGIDFEIVPGISSSYAVGAYAGIPITHRDYASSFHVITGHENAEKTSLSLDFKTIAKEEGTLVFMMSLKALPSIMKQLIENGKSPETPVAVIHQGTTPKQKCVIGTLETITDKVLKAEIKTPALIIIGEVVRLRDKIAWYEKQNKPLWGKSIMLTGTPNVSAELSASLEKLGAETFNISLIKTTAINQNKLLETNFNKYSWIVFSSNIGVNIFFESYIKANKDIRQLAGIKIAAIGEKTALQLRKYGISVDCIPNQYESKYLAEKLIPQLDSKDNVLLLRAETASQVLTDAFKANGIQYTQLAIYKTETNLNRKSLVNVNAGIVDYTIFSSSSAVTAYTQLVDSYKNIDTKYIAIGAVTAKTIEKAGLQVYSIAQKSTNDGIIECILEDLSAEI